jgi:hypothetical protein
MGLLQELVGRDVVVVSIGETKGAESVRPQMFEGILASFDEQWLRLDHPSGPCYVPVSTIRYIKRNESTSEDPNLTPWQSAIPARSASTWVAPQMRAVANVAAPIASGGVQASAGSDDWASVARAY